MPRLVLLVVLAALSACASDAPRTAVVEIAPDQPQIGWRAIVTSQDSQRLSSLPDIWKAALAAAKRYQTQIRREGDLLAPDAARNHPAPPPGSYRCRLVKLGAPAGRDPAFRVYNEFFCYIRGARDDALFFTKQTGSELPGGWLHPDDARRYVLTGAKQRPGSAMPLAYGEEPERDLVGILERIGPFRWRLVLPWRGDRPGLDVYELTPVPPDQQAEEPRDEAGD